MAAWRRRQMLRAAASTAGMTMIGGKVLWIGGCGDGSKIVPPGAQARELVDASRFPLGVGSADPEAGSAVFWTKLAADAGEVALTLEVALDPDFREVVASVPANASAQQDLTVQPALTGLPQGRTLYYRFVETPTRTSPIGRLRALPENPDRIRFGFVSCQDYLNGYYSAYRHLAREDLDFVVHLGDYIYETVGARTSLPVYEDRAFRLNDDPRLVLSLDDYRRTYQAYRSDPDLQRAHARLPFLNIWDDHEFTNNAAGTFGPSNGSEDGDKFQPRRRAAANQAYSEYIPGAYARDLTAEDPLEQIRLFRTVRFGNLMKLILLDERMFRDRPPCGGGFAVPDGCPEQQLTTMLGEQQRNWLLEELRDPEVQWKVLGNQVTMMKIMLQNLWLNLDQWDGYDGERRMLMGFLREHDIKDVLVITGDIHMFFVGELSENFAADETPVAVECTSSSITSSNIGTPMADLLGGIREPAVNAEKAVLLSNPHMRYFNSRDHGYTTVDVTPEEAIFTLNAVSSIRNPNTEETTVRPVFRFRVRAGSSRVETLPVA